jgi:hypothetical protein
MFATTLGSNIERVTLQFVRLENWYSQCVFQQFFIFIHHVSQSRGSLQRIPHCVQQEHMQ